MKVRRAPCAANPWVHAGRHRRGAAGAERHAAGEDAEERHGARPGRRAAPRAARLRQVDRRFGLHGDVVDAGHDDLLGRRRRAPFRGRRLTGRTFRAILAPTLSMIVDREKEIEKFVPENYWQLGLVTEKAGEQIEATAHEWQV